MANLLRAVRESLPDHDIVTSSPNLPGWAIIREIDLRIDQTVAGREFVFFYSQFKRIMQVAPPGQPGDFNSILRAVCAPGYVFDGGPSVPVPPYSTLLSLSNHDLLTYVIFKLAPGTWQFAREGRSIKMGDAGHASGAYHDANRVDRTGTPDPGNPGNIKDGCKVAYFIANGPKATAHGSYPHGFNLYVDLPVTNAPTAMPLIMDPDVRYPGGSSE